MTVTQTDRLSVCVSATTTDERAQYCESRGHVNAECSAVGQCLSEWAVRQSHGHPVQYGAGGAWRADASCPASRLLTNDSLLTLLSECDYRVLRRGRGEVGNSRGLLTVTFTLAAIPCVPLTSVFRPGPSTPDCRRPVQSAMARITNGRSEWLIPDAVLCRVITPVNSTSRAKIRVLLTSNRLTSTDSTQ